MYIIQPKPLAIFVFIEGFKAFFYFMGGPAVALEKNGPFFFLSKKCVFFSAFLQSRWDLIRFSGKNKLDVIQACGQAFLFLAVLINQRTNVSSYEQESGHFILL